MFSYMYSQIDLEYICEHSTGNKTFYNVQKYKRKHILMKVLFFHGLVGFLRGSRGFQAWPYQYQYTFNVLARGPGKFLQVAGFHGHEHSMCLCKCSVGAPSFGKVVARRTRVTTNVDEWSQVKDGH